MKRERRNRRGVALVLVLGSIAIMTIMLTEFQDEATGEESLADAIGELLASAVITDATARRARTRGQCFQWRKNAMGVRQSLLRAVA